MVVKAGGVDQDARAVARRPVRAELASVPNADTRLTISPASLVIRPSALNAAPK